jgi:DnaD/phage-associated family protein
MTRPQKQTVDYFPHDAGASDGDTINVLQSCWGNDGYAFWFKLLEKLAGSEGHFIDCRNTEKWQLFLGKTRVDPVAGEAIMRKLADLGAIDPDLWRIHRVIWCQHFVDNIADVYKNRRRLIPQKPIISTTNLQVASCRMSVETPTPLVEKRITTGDNPQSKLKETKLKETKEDDNPLPPETPEDLSSSSEKTVDKSELNIYQLYDQEIGTLTAGISTLLKDAEIQYPVEWIAEAIKQAVQANKRSWSYIKAILENCKAEKHSPGSRSGKKTSAKDDPGYYFGGKYGHVVKH